MTNKRYNCFIRKNTEYIREGLKNLGIPQNTFDDGTRPWIAFNHGMWISVDEGHDRLFPDDIDCGDNEDLFLAIAALRDNTDFGQWFKIPKIKTLPIPGYCGQQGMNGFVHGVEFVNGFAYYKIILIVWDVIFVGLMIWLSLILRKRIRLKKSISIVVEGEIEEVISEENTLQNE